MGTATGTAIILVSVTAISVLLILLPFDRRRREADSSWESPDTHAGDLETLLAKKDSIYVGIKDLDFEYETGKLSTQDYETLKEAYARDAIEVLKAVDERTAWIKQARPVAGRRARRGKKQPTDVEVLCAGCGSQLDASDNFCNACGASQTLACTQCGARCERDDRFCSGCGAELAIRAGAQ